MLCCSSQQLANNLIGLGGELAGEHLDCPIGPRFSLGFSQLDTHINLQKMLWKVHATWPSWYKPLHALMFFLAPEVINWYSRSIYVACPDVDSSNNALTVFLRHILSWLSLTL
ncbi:hypothetical protein IEQ34_007612 [Dendrobium chrysotoxum]|uniref:Uncharacterized protein n=1 Tax=Dendrobium chrysotoxum TaxID=161865 RepID=A0AAV7H4B5_DENCH|nr:hypothetical protein IEQ34_007612 [Dendrobium chrysotoxum]